MPQLSSKHRSWLGYFLIGLTAAIGLAMYNRAQAELLWGYRPLFFYLSIYFAWVALRPRREKKEFVGKETTAEIDDVLQNTPVSFPQLSNRQLAILGGGLLGLGFPGYLPYPILLFVAWVPLLVLQQRLVQEKASGKRVFAVGFGAFLLFNILSTYWVTNTGLAAGLSALLPNSLLMCIPWWIFNRVSRSLPRVSHLAFFAPWLAFEFCHYRWQLNWPWLDLGNGLGQNPWMAQWYEFTGTGGGSLWILLVNYLVFLALTSRQQATTVRPAWRAWAIVALVFALPQVSSWLMFKNIDVNSGETIYVAAINPNAEPHFEKFGQGSQRAALDSFTYLSQAAIDNADGIIDYIVFPETSFGGIIENHPFDRRSPLNDLLNRLPTDRFRYLVTGYSGYYEFGPDEFVTPSVRYAGDRAYEALNGVIQIETATLYSQTYRKGVFVPGAESFPYARILGFLGPMMDQLGGSIAGYGTQPERTTLDGVAKIGPAICYEADFGDYATGYVKAGAQAIFIMTNDGWWDNTAGHRQHLWINSLRAIESRRAIARAANLGNCAFIDARGQLQATTTYNKKAYLLGRVQLREGQTFYVRQGDLIGRIAALLSVMLLLSLIARPMVSKV